MDTSVLEEIGMTNAEIKIYIALLELGSSTAGPVIEKTGLQNSVVHLTLHKLLEKGFVSYVKKGKVKYYNATEPKNIINFIEERKHRLELLIPELLVKQKKQERPEAEIFEGFRGFKAMLYEFIKDTKPGDEYLFFSFDVENPEEFMQVYNFYSKEFDKIRKKRGLTVKGIAPVRLKHLFKGREKYIQYRLVDFPVLTNISILKNKVIFTPLKHNLVSFMITSQQLADSFKLYFYSIWNTKNKTKSGKNRH